MDWRSRITIEPGKRAGKPTIRGLRITVSDVLDYLASGSVRLLLDQNLSPRLTAALADLFPESRHVRDVGLASAEDAVVWHYAADHDFTIVSKDADFHERSFLLGTRRR